MSSFNGPDVDSAGTAHGNGAVMSPEKCAFVEEMLLNILHIIQTIHVQILVFGQYENHVWRLG